MGDSPTSNRSKLFVSPFVLQPPMCFQYPGGSTVSTKVTGGPGTLTSFQLGQQHPLIHTCQRQMNFLMGGTSLFPKWRDAKGNPWQPLTLNGVLDDDTEDALQYHQSLWGLPPTGRLCLLTRTLLYPSMRLHGQLTYKRSVATGGGTSGTPGIPAKPAQSSP